MNLVRMDHVLHTNKQMHFTDTVPLTRAIVCEMNFAKMDNELSTKNEINLNSKINLNKAWIELSPSLVWDELTTLQLNR